MNLLNSQIRHLIPQYGAEMQERNNVVNEYPTFGTTKLIVCQKIHIKIALNSKQNLSILMLNKQILG